MGGQVRQGEERSKPEVRDRAATITITDSRGKSFTAAVTDAFAHGLAISLAQCGPNSLTFGTARGGTRRLPCTSFRVVPQGGDVPSLLGSLSDEGGDRGQSGSDKES